MTLGAILDSLTEEASGAIRELLHRAYDRGYREALAASGQPAGPAPSALVALETAGRPTPHWDAATDPEEDEPDGAVETADSPDAADAGPDDDGDDSDDRRRPGPVVRPIMPHATVGTLRKRIERTFQLERFDIEVVVCRRGDRDRRRLKSSARLRLYLRKEP